MEVGVSTMGQWEPIVCEGVRLAARPHCPLSTAHYVFELFGCYTHSLPLLSSWLMRQLSVN
eukprot:scaffold291027_cov26-Tisochrysis_lutea.AAC.1